MASELVAITRKVEETVSLAAALAKELEASDALCLFGDLGAGKTTFVRGIVRALGGEEELVTSPTFTLENRYPIAGPRGIQQVVHADLYRIETGDEEDLLASLLEAREDGALILVEWAQALSAYLQPCWNLEITLQRTANREELERHFTLTRSAGSIGRELATSWRGVMSS
jgi:tRNA threonylcarbamoyladenosine biosynthesis protein TsaE